jgi:hypothetical protein
MRALKGLAFLVVVCAMSVPAWATTTFAIDDGNLVDTAMTNNAEPGGQMIWLNTFSTGGPAIAINQMSVAFPNNLPAYQTAPNGPSAAPTIQAETIYMDLYKDGPSQAGNPNDAGTTLLYQTSFTYNTSTPSGQYINVSVPNIAVTGKFFVGVCAYARGDNSYTEYDDDAVGMATGLAGNRNAGSWVGWFNGTGPFVIDQYNLSDTGGGQTISPYSQWNVGGVNMIRAAGDAVPEPITMTSLFLALGGLGTWVRRRAKAQA